jgi:hypothetical protein
MRYVTALFDAPIPARHALGALREAGFEARDIACIPALPDRPEDGAQLDMTAEAFAGLGLPTAFTHVALEGLERGAILICLRTPELSAEHAARLLDEAGAQAPETLARAWAAEPELRYGWRELPAPRVEGMDDEAELGTEPTRPEVATEETASREL